MADRIRKINSTTGETHALITTDSLASGARINGIAVSPNGTVYAADYANHVVYKIYEQGRILGVLVGELTTSGDTASSGMYGSDGLDARLDSPYRLCVDASENIWVSDRANHKIKRLSPSGRCQTLAGTGVAGNVVDDDGLTCQFNNPTGITVDKSGNLYVCDLGNFRIKKVYPSGKTVVLAGSTTGFANGNGNDVKFASCYGLDVDPSGIVYVADYGNNRIRRLDQAGNVVTLAGYSAGFVDGSGNAARFSGPSELVLDPSGRFMFVLDYSNTAIRRVTSNGTVTTFANWPAATANAMAMDKSGFLYYLEDNV